MQRQEGGASPSPTKVHGVTARRYTPCPLVQVVHLAQSIAASDTLAFVLIDCVNARCSNTFCITVSRLNECLEDVRWPRLWFRPTTSISKRWPVLPGRNKES